MKFDNKTTFPHPVLGVRDDIMPLPDFDYSKHEDETDYIYEIKIKLNNPSIKYYIDTKKAEYVCEVDCKRTYYRVCTSSKTHNFKIQIPKNRVSGEVKITLTVSTTIPIPDYCNSNANSDYNGYTFSLERGDVIAFIGSLTIHTDIMSNEYKAVGSFIHFEKGAPDSGISYYLGGNDIKITLPQEMFDTYTRNLKGKKYRPAVMASIINEALIYALSQYHNYEECRWARLLSSADVLSGHDFSKEIDIADAIDMAHEILNQPHNALFASLESMLDDEE